MSFTAIVAFILIYMLFKKAVGGTVNKALEVIDENLESAAALSRTGRNKAQAYEQISEKELEIAKQEKLRAIEQRKKKIEGLEL